MADPYITLEITGTKEVEQILRDATPKMAKSLLRSTVRALATEIRKSAIGAMVWTQGYSTGKTKRGTKVRARRVRDGLFQTDVVVQGAFWWRYHEYGNGNVAEKAMFGRAVHRMRSKLAIRFNDLFLKKLTAYMARQAKRRN